MIVGLTGKICAGKDSFASFLPKDRFFVIDVDGLGHDALRNNIEKLESAFGSSIISCGNVDRKSLGSIVFADPEKLEILNDITHPWMKEEALRLAHECEEKGIIPVINAALLESMGFVDHCDIIVLVTAPYEAREKRAMLRSNLTSNEFRKRSDAQKEIGLSLFSSARRIITIVNDEGEEKLRNQAGLFVSICLAK